MQQKQNITLRVAKTTIRKAKLLAAERGTSVSKLLASQIDEMVGEAEAYEAARRTALGFLERGFHLGGTIHCARDEWHER